MSLPDNIGAHPRGAEGNDLGILSYVPPGYLGPDDADWPLLVYMHGYNGNGDGSVADLHNVLNEPDVIAIPQLIASGEWPADRPFIVVMPQYGFQAAQHCELGDEIAGVLDWAEQMYRVDPERIYLTGISCGAIGLMDYLVSIFNQDNRIAASVPVASAPPFAWEKAGCELARHPMWLFHGELDDTVPVHYPRDVVADLNACTDPPAREVKLTVYPDGGHDNATWMTTYDGSSGNDIYEWMLEHRLTQ